jgi:hypothetical protein
MPRRDLNLDVDSPEKVARVLRRAAEAYYESAGELDAAWQDPGAGRPWDKLAKILDRAADSAEAALKKIRY